MKFFVLSFLFILSVNSFAVTIGQNNQTLEVAACNNVDMYGDTFILLYPSERALKKIAKSIIATKCSEINSSADDIEIRILNSYKSGHQGNSKCRYGSAEVSFVCK